LGPTVGPMEVQCEDFRDFFRPALVTLLEDVCYSAVELPPAPEGETFVRAISDKRMAEAEMTRDVRIAFDKLGEPVPRLGVGGGGRVALEDVRDQRPRERDAEHGRPAEQ